MSKLEVVIYGIKICTPLSMQPNSQTLLKLFVIISLYCSYAIYIYKSLINFREVGNGATSLCNCLKGMVLLTSEVS